MSIWQRRGLCMLCGLALALGAAPFSFPWLVFIAVPVLAWLLVTEITWGEGFGVGWWAGLAYFAGSMFWIVEPFFVEPERHGWMAPFALVFLSGGLALFWGAAFGLATVFWGAARILAMVILWTLAEFVRAHIFTGFPWGLIAYGWVSTPVFQLLSVMGPHGLGFATLLLAALPMMVRREVALAVMILGLGGAMAFGMLRLAPTALTDTTVRLVQPNAPQDQKWQPDMVRVFFDRALALTPSETADIVVWPETSVPFLWGEAPGAERLMIEAAGRAHLVAGHRRYEGIALYNSMLHLAPGGRMAANYDKHHLVPFGEYVPFGNLLGLVGLAANDGVGFASGPGPRIIEVEGVPRYLPLICYEAIFPGLAQIPGDRPDWLLHLTNDAWFGKFSGPYQHLVQARARAVEQGLPVARAANTGISAMIDPYGRLMEQAALNTSGAVETRLPLALPPTSYGRLGEWPWLVLAGGLLLGLLLGRARNGGKI